MRVLVSETPDKKTRSYINVEPDFLLKLIENDYGLHEVIDMFNPDMPIRLFFDIDVEDIGDQPHSEYLTRTLTMLNAYYKTTDSDWTITSANTDKKASYHIYSSKYYTTLKKLRNDILLIRCPYIDGEIYYFSLQSVKDEGSLRLPNQSKGSINKEGAIHRLFKGNLNDCLITIIKGLTMI